MTVTLFYLTFPKEDMKKAEEEEKEEPEELRRPHPSSGWSYFINVYLSGIPLVQIESSEV